MMHPRNDLPGTDGDANQDASTVPPSHTVVFIIVAIFAAVAGMIVGIDMTLTRCGL